MHHATEIDAFVADKQRRYQAEVRFLQGLNHFLWLCRRP